MSSVLQTEGTGVETTDPRILRSRRMLMDALGRLLTRKDFDDIAINEIAQEATLNRATFYLHYPDKNALLQAMTAERFGALITRRGLSFSTCDGGLRAIALGVCDYLVESTECPEQLTKMPLERSIIPVVEAIFRKGAEEHPLAAGVHANLLAATAAWAIFGAARRWYEMPDRSSAEEAAAEIEALVGPIFASSVTG